MVPKVYFYNNFLHICHKEENVETFKPKINTMEKRWMGLLQPTFKLRWVNTWCKQHNKKNSCVHMVYLE